MRSLAILPFFALLAGCWTPGPGELDPTLYPWHPRNRAVLDAEAAATAPHRRIEARDMIAPSADWDARPGEQQGTYCIVSLEPRANSGIVLGGSATALACAAPANPEPEPKPR